MRICVFGAGAIGGHLAARLALRGAEVSVVARGDNLRAMGERGITLRAPDGTFAARPRAAAAAAELGSQDAVLVTVKAPALPAAAEAIQPLLGPETPVVFVTNGIPWWYFDREGGPREGTRLPLVDPGDAIRTAIGTARTIGGVVWSACTVTEPGTVHVQTPQSRLVLGELDGRVTPRLEALAAAIGDTDAMRGEATPDIRTAVWTKLLNNLTNGPACLLTRQDMKTTFSDPVVLRSALTVMREGLALAAALGRPIPGDSESRILRSVGVAHKPSILQDSEAGRPLEFDALLTQPLDLAREAGVPMPVLELLVAMARQATGHRAPA
ncbi:MAG: 2-dehydropantoate 2-reductase [Acetobacteraceae bacterium]|nr:2-dehydropantoate 2-reductase [Acetobacteraceae bacterium]